MIRRLSRSRWLSVAAGVTAALFACAAMAAQTPTRLCFNEALGGADSQHFSILMLQAIEREQPDEPFELVALPWLRCQTLASRGEFDGMVGASYTEERGEALAFPRDAQGSVDEALRMFRLGIVLLRRKGTTPDWDGRNFSGILGRVGVDRGFSNGQFARAQGLRVDEDHPDTPAMMAKLRAGRLDAVLVSEPQAADYLGPSTGAPLEVAGGRVTTKAFYLVLSKAFADRRPEAAAALWQAVARERETPRFLRVYSEQQGFLVEGGRP